MASLVVNYRHEEKAWETLEQLEGVLPTVCMGPDGAVQMLRRHMVIIPRNRTHPCANLALRIPEGIGQLQHPAEVCT